MYVKGERKRAEQHAAASHTLVRNKFRCSSTMQLIKVAILVNFFLVFTLAESYLNSTQKLRRRKRYVAFPDGSSVSAAICLTIGVVGNPNVDYLSWAVNWGVAYNLPDYAWARKHAGGFSNATKTVVQRRSRRDLYKKLELMIDNMGYNGNDCISRALCESAQTLQHIRKLPGNMIEEIFRTIFSLPVVPDEHDYREEHSSYDRVYRRAKRSKLDCALKYSSCHFSLLELAYAKYSADAAKFGSTVAFM